MTTTQDSLSSLKQTVSYLSAQAYARRSKPDGARWQSEFDHFHNQLKAALQEKGETA